MSKLDDIFKNELPEAYEIHGFENTKQKIKALFLELIGDQEIEYSNLDGNAGYWEKHGRNEFRKQLTKAVQDL